MTISNRQPEFQNLLKVLRCEVPKRPTLFEFFMNIPLYEKLAGRKEHYNSYLDIMKLIIDAYRNAGYDYATVYASDFKFSINNKEHKSTLSLNEGMVITDRASFDAYDWPDPESFDYSRLEKIEDYLGDNMKLMIMGPDGVLENVTKLVGYDNLCYMLFDDPELVQEIFDSVGSRLVKYYEIAAQYNSVGVLISNDDWGFNSQTLLSVDDLRKYVFPWHKRIVEVIHKASKPAVLHSCGYMNDVMEDIITYMGFDGKHSYEDNILSVEESYKRWGGRIAILGGIDVNFLITSSEEEITKRCRNMIDTSMEDGGYALGSGNSIPDYIPYEKFMAMIKSALDY
ncbi:MAG: uroporphyrinogen decarboxylase family protein [Oscillospiraceae bacterium]|nr:uroporphyrinogen decarboxylase family protein [Oscillospiraceae bacterium]MDD4413531.1 uroporphyrinogen decarboxylase family protein [Oscillospiraceae bacterium]